MPRSHSKRRQGFNLLEVIVTLPVVLMGMYLGAQLVHRLLQQDQRNQTLGNVASQMDETVRQMRTDAWGASAINVDSPKQCEITTAGITVRWHLSDDGQAVRGVVGNADQAWPGLADAHFEARADGVNLVNEIASDSPAITLYSQLLLLKEKP